jgi:hypothetical protein
LRELDRNGYCELMAFKDAHNSDRFDRFAEQARGMMKCESVSEHLPFISFSGV